MKLKNIIYGLTEPDGKTVRYIGKSTIGLTRPNQHKKVINLQPINHKNNWIRSLIAENQMYGIKIIEEVQDVTILDQREIYWIAEYKKNGANLTNSTSGGEGALGRINSDDTKEKIRQKKIDFHKNNPQVALELGKKQRKPRIINAEGVEQKHCSDCEIYLSLENFCKNKQAADGVHGICRPCTQKRTAKYRAANPTKKLTPEQLKQSYIDRKAKMTEGVQNYYNTNKEASDRLKVQASKPILRITPSTGEIKEYSSALEAKRLDKFDNTYISQAIKSGQQYKNYYWSFKS